MSSWPGQQVGGRWAIDARHEPRYWPEYRAYCAFVTDPDDNNVEAVHKEIPTPTNGTG